MISFRLFALIGIAFLLLGSSCENDLKDVEQISSQKLAVQVDRSEDVEVIYSDSAIVKAKLVAPVVLHYKTADPYYEMPKGILVIFFDENQKETGRTTADYAVRRELKKVVELKKNVLVVNAKGQQLKSDEIIWDENQHRFYSDKLVILTSPNGTTLYGTGFWADENLKNYNIDQATGPVYVPKQEGF